jgi:glycosyltransferase involved in cell wall biosynthesis
MCLLDNTSGAALSARTYLEVLATAGFSCSSFTAALFDPNREMDRGGVLGPASKKPEAIGKRLIIDKSGVTHSIYLTKHSQSKNMQPEEQKGFEAAWVKWLINNKPDIVMTFGGSPYTTRLQNHARKRGIQIVHYLGNAEYQSDRFQHSGDIVVCPSHFLQDHYKETLGIDAQVLRNIIKPDRLDLNSIKSKDSLLARKAAGFVTYMNPIPHKGLTLFYQLAKLAERYSPQLKFLVTEGRTNREWLAARGYDLSTMKNVWFMSNHEDVRSIYQRTAILLIPSFWKEGLGRSIIEAQLKWDSRYGNQSRRNSGGNEWRRNPF